MHLRWVLDLKDWWLGASAYIVLFMDFGTKDNCFTPVRSLDQNDLWLTFEQIRNYYAQKRIEFLQLTPDDEIGGIYSLRMDLM